MTNRTGWKSESVRALAGGSDPVRAIEAKARELVLDAMDKGWSGPPFDPIKLARQLGIGIAVSDEINDARLIPTGKTATIEYNPNRPRGRIRFSVAHEIAHTLFPDFAVATRYRDAARKEHADREVETLCNIAAAEIIMPVGSFREMLQGEHNINALMELRRKLDVSTEALLMRYVRLSEQPVLMFCASASEKGDYHIDYIVGSRAAAPTRLSDIELPKKSRIRECTAIGFTASFDERWGAVGMAHIQCVGLPGFEGSRLPRVAGLLKSGGGKRSEPLLRYVHGDATEPRNGGSKIVCQIVNDQALNWSPRGFPAAVRRRWPKAQEEYREWVAGTGRKERLGAVHFWTEHDVTVASMIAQAGFGPATDFRLRYAALARCLSAVAGRAQEEIATVHMPRIGTGQAGGSWELVEEIIYDELPSRGIQTTIYDLPPQPQQLELG